MLKYYIIYKMNKTRKNKLFQLYVYMLCWLCSCTAETKQSNTFKRRTFISQHRLPSHYYDVNEYHTGQAYRRQEVIHPIDEDSGNNKSTDDDIEKYGKTIDSTGAMLKSDVSKQRKNEVSTKDIIAKIKEIQDKIFKRTGSKELEARLKQMNPQGIPEPLVPEKSIQVSGDRRKIIPEDVVDKILQKFQQLRSEAKHIVLSGDQTKQTKEKPTESDGLQRKLDTASESPYASIGPPKESMEIKNRTEQANDVAALRTDGTPEPVVNNHDIQIPIGSTSSDIKNNDKSPSQGIPLMFVKNGENLIPVFSPGQAGQQAPVSIAGQSSVQFNTNSGVALPPVPNNVVPINNGNPLASFMSGDLEAGKNIQSPPVIDASLLASLQSQADTRCTVPGPDCMQPAVQDVPSPGPGQETMELLNRLLHAPGFPQLASHLLGENMGAPQINGPQLESHFQENINPWQSNIPDPHLASHFLEDTMRSPQSSMPGAESTSNFFRNNMSPGQSNMLGPSQYYNPIIPTPQSGQSRALNSLTSGSNNRVEFPMSSDDVYGTNPASIQFGLKQNLASNFPGTPSMLQHENLGRTDYNEEVRHFLDNLPHNDPSGPAQPPELYSPSPTKQLLNQYDPRTNRQRTINDISDPIDNQMSNQFGEKSPDELLEFAKYRSLTAPDSQPIGDLSKPFFGGKEGYATNTADRVVDPSNLLDTLHDTQLKNRLAGAGDPTNSNDLASYHEYEEDKDYREQGYGKENAPEPAPDDLLDRLRHLDQNMQNSKPTTRHRIPAEKFGSMDPSFADEIRTNDGNIQSFDVERKDVATEHNSNNKLLTSRRPVHRHGDISVLSDDMLQYRHGRLSMDSDDVLNSFKKEQTYSRNSIGRPGRRRHRRRYVRTYIPPLTRGVIERPRAPSNSDVELRVNGALITDNTSLRSTIVDGKLHPGKGKTFASKDPVQIELSHGDDKRKIINIITKGRYNITQNASSKRNEIPQLELIT